MIMMEVDALMAEWLKLKAEEKTASDKRREIEDILAGMLKIAPFVEGTTSGEAGNFKYKVVNRLTRKVDVDKLQSIAVENGLLGHLNDLFRWSAEINLLQWKRTSSKITDVLSEAITTKNGRPSFSIETTGE